jgi:putative oxidoreductase
MNAPRGRLLDIALLILRIGIGAFFIVHGLPKLMGGTEMWKGLGSNMSLIGITFWPPFWGFMAAIAEFGGGVLLIVGLLTRPAAAMLAFTMFIAVLLKIDRGSAEGDLLLDMLGRMAHPAELLFVFLFFLLVGSGQLSVAQAISPQKNRWWL